ncbi:MAG: SDR family oxidoreductase [Dehalococcoidia bacterium]|nr:SDR family oxidoreductase [Dehalococcoidia bacterium]
MKVHLYGHFNCIKHACIIFRQQRSGRIINTSSAAGLGNMGQANYSAAKEGIVGLTRTVARDMGKYGVTCNAVRPMVATRMTMTPELAAAWAKRAEAGISAPAIPVGAPEAPGAPLPGLAAMPPEGVSPVVVWLCTDAAAHVNGCTFDAHGVDIGLWSEPTIIKSIHKKGIWTQDELEELMPRVTEGLVNPSPPVPPKC